MTKPRAMKNCKRCKQTKQKYFDFSAYARNPDGRCDMCRECQQELRDADIPQKRSHKAKPMPKVRNEAAKGLEAHWYGSTMRIPETPQQGVKHLQFSDGWMHEIKTTWRGPNAAMSGMQRMD